MSDTNTPASALEPPATRPRRAWLWLFTGLVAGFLLGILVTSSSEPPNEPRASVGQSNSGDVPAGDSDRASLPTTPPDESPGGTNDTKGEESHEHGAAPSGWREAVEGFGQTFTNTSLGQETWHNAISAWLTPAQAEKYQDVPVEHIPTGELVDVQVADPGGALFTSGLLTYDTDLVLQVGLTYDANSGGWLVASVKEA